MTKVKQRKLAKGITITNIDNGKVTTELISAKGRTYMGTKKKVMV